MIMYVGSFFVVWTPFVLLSFVVIPVYGYSMTDVYWLVLLNEFTFPLQGFLNAFIYFKPAYKRFREANPENSAWSALQQALFSQTLPKTFRHRDGQGVTHRSDIVIDD